MPDDPAIAVSAVSHRYGDRPALSAVSLTVARGTIVGLLGPNGSGKSTLFRILSTLLPLQSGTARICGHDLTQDAQDVRRRIGVSFQSPALDVRLTVGENLACHAMIYGLSRSECRRRTSRLLQQFSLSEQQHVLVGTLSGGYRRRVEIAKALLHEPELLLLDEPTVGLDPAARREFWQVLREARRVTGTTVVVATHLMDEAEFCDDLILLCEGRVAVTGAPQVLRSELGHDQLRIRGPEVAALQSEIEEQIGGRSEVHGETLTVVRENPGDCVAELCTRFGDRITALEIARPTLEDVFLHHTGHSLTDREEF